MRRFEEYLAEKLLEPDFATAFYSDSDPDAASTDVCVSLLDEPTSPIGSSITTDIAQQVTTLRMLRGLTQHHLAERVSTRQSSISRLESGAFKPSIAFLERIAEALDADIEVRIVPRHSSN